MKTTLAFALTVLLLPVSATAEDGAKSATLFNGKNLDGWRGMQGEPKNWSATGGTLIGSGGEGAQWLATTKEYADFDLSLEFSLRENGNSGIFIRAPKEGSPWVDGIEIQLLDDYGEKWKDLKPDQFTGAIYAVQAPSKRATKPGGKWQKLRILCVGDDCQVWVNGEQVIDADLAKLSKSHGEKVPGLKRKSGLIGLQNHGDPVAFKNIQIKEIGGDNKGWIDLFEEDGWAENKFKHDPVWTFADGVLTGHGGQGYFHCAEEFDDFELVVQARISDTAGGRGNSGVYFRCGLHSDKTQEYPPGYEAQLDHGDKNNPTGSIYGLKVEGAKAPELGTKDGEWVTMGIRAVGNHIETWVNGKPAADCRDPEYRHMKGYILLQMHHKTGKVEFRDLRVRRIKKTE